MRTLVTPILVRVAKDGKDLVGSERLEIRYRENFREPFPERFHRKLRSISEECVENLVDVFLNVRVVYSRILAAGLQVGFVDEKSDYRNFENSYTP
jgi:hypothetical protein